MIASKQNSLSKKKRVTIYARRSDESGDRERSIAEQITACRRWAEERGHRVVSIVEELGSGVTGKDRPGFVKLIEAAEKSPRDFDLIVTLDVSRFGRFDPDERGFWIHRLRVAGVEVAHVLDGEALAGPAGAVVGAVLQTAANDHSRKTGYKVALAQRAAVDRGVWPGGRAPFGYRRQRREGWDGHGRRDTRLAVYEPEAKVVRRIFDLYVAGHGYVAVAGVLNEARTPCPRSSGWVHSTIAAILANRAYCGDLVRTPGARSKFYSATADGVVPVAERGEVEPIVVRDAVPPIVSRETWEQARDIRDRRHAVPTGGGARRLGLLAGIARCEVCGGPLATHGTTPRGRARYRYSVCARAHDRGDRGACAGVRVRTERLEAAVLTEVRAEAAKIDPKRIAAAVRRLHGHASEAKDEVSTLEARRRRLQERRRKLAISDDDDEVVQGALRDISAEVRRLTDDIERARAAQAREVDVDALVAEVVEAARQLQAEDTDEAREALRGVLQAWIPRLVVGTAGRGQPRPVTMTVLTVEGLAATTAFTPTLRVCG
jgi:hypothetical protein